MTSGAVTEFGAAFERLLFDGDLGGSAHHAVGNGGARLLNGTGRPYPSQMPVKAALVEAVQHTTWWNKLLAPMLFTTLLSSSGARAI